MGSILILLFVLGFLMSDNKEKIELIKELIINIGGAIIGLLVIIFILDKIDLLSFNQSIYFLKRIMFGNPF